jgi:hypothetical protein
MFQANAVQINAFQIALVPGVAPAAAAEEVRSKGGWDPYYYKRRNKRRDSEEDVHEFLAEGSDHLAPQPIQAQQEAARIAAAKALAALRGDRAAAQAALANALAEINQFYVLIREQARIMREEEEDDEMLLLLS